MLGLDFEQFDEKSFRFIEALTVADKKALDVILSSILEAAGEIGAKRLVLDSITAVTSMLTKEEVRAFLHTTLMRAAKKMGMTAILIADLPFGAKAIGHGIEELS